MFAKAGWTEARMEHKQDATSMHRCEVKALSSTHDVDIVSANGIQEPPGPPGAGLARDSSSFWYGLLQSLGVNFELNRLGVSHSPSCGNPCAIRPIHHFSRRHVVSS